MAKKSKTQKKIMNMVYGLGASIVILGALFKINHIEFLGIGGGTLLAIGLITEAFIFFISAFEPVEEEYDWSLVFPELKGGEARNFGTAQAQNTNAVSQKEIQETLSAKLDVILKEAKIDAELMQALAKNIRNFEEAAKGITPVTEAIAASNKYNEELSLAAVHLESLNSLYKIQLEKTEKQVEAQDGIAENLSSLNSQVDSFKNNLGAINKVYAGMLSAMGGNK